MEEIGNKTTKSSEPVCKNENWLAYKPVTYGVGYSIVSFILGLISSIGSFVEFINSLVCEDCVNMGNISPWILLFGVSLYGGIKGLSIHNDLKKNRLKRKTITVVFSIFGLVFSGFACIYTIITLGIIGMF